MDLQLQRLREEDTTLRERGLGSNRLTDASGAALAAALHTNTTLRHLSPDANKRMDASGTAMTLASSGLS